MSSTYTLNDTTPSDIGGIIGKGASGLKKVISESWFNIHIDSENDRLMIKNNM